MTVGLGQAAVGGEGDELVAFGLGSCIGLAVWSPRLRLGAFCHVVLPRAPGADPDPDQPARYADQAVVWALEALARLGARPRELVAKLAGGARVLAAPLLPDIGAANAEAVADALRAAGIPVVAADVGGNHGRTARFLPGTGALEVRAAGAPARWL